MLPVLAIRSGRTTSGALLERCRWFRLSWKGGATCVGKTVVDELAYMFVIFVHCFISNGVSKHYGTPTNPVAHARAPGGSCSGAIVVVAANLVDFSLKKDKFGPVLSWPQRVKIVVGAARDLNIYMKR
ncbi:hypothetical protein Pint_18367 [Pistacia integerrima]|uniref:Uncharacterized protein n=1 Tax=Pistacia integerrima TaxID=434235 RepID=A0ACC0YY99_9ROSI|nr:hypothetical protein Pint_18367 [Pistacia integerrima]